MFRSPTIDITGLSKADIAFLQQALEVKLQDIVTRDYDPGWRTSEGWKQTHPTIDLPKLVRSGFMAHKRFRNRNEYSITILGRQALEKNQIVITGGDYIINFRE